MLSQNCWRQCGETHWTGKFAQLQSVARQHGIDWRHDGTSHCIFIRADGQTLPVPAHRPIKPIYVKKFVALVDGA